METGYLGKQSSKCSLLTYYCGYCTQICVHTFGNCVFTKQALSHIIMQNMLAYYFYEIGCSLCSRMITKAWTQDSKSF